MMSAEVTDSVLHADINILSSPACLENVYRLSTASFSAIKGSTAPASRGLERNASCLGAQLQRPLDGVLFLVDGNLAIAC
jgi:hypothetical protein